jgi:asparagine synthase (glutamine-hydrolysing)
MCGIAGLYRFDGDIRDSAIVSEMTDLLSHRGPDGFGLESCHNLIFGHRRLSIIDLADGAQPLWSHDKNLLITFNGEIYNYLELKKDLQSIGHRFTTNSDTEVILELYRRWGVEAFKKLNGQFAFALYDLSRRDLFLVRDIVGEKPLYYTVNNNYLAFASEVKSLVYAKRSLGESVELSGQALSEFLALNYIPGRESAIAGVFKLTPGHYLRVANGKVSEHSFRTIEEDGNFDTSDLTNLLRQSVRLRLRSDVPLGIFLSGGLDSALVASYAAEEGNNIKAYCADFKEPTFSEIKASLAIAKRLGLESKVVEIDIEKIDLPSIIDKLAFHGDEPLADSSALPVYLLSQATAQEVKVVLSGDGGDELFGGYLTYNATELASRLPRELGKLLSKLANLPYLLPASNSKVSWQEKLNRFLRNLDLSPAAAHFAWNGMHRAVAKMELLGDRYSKYADETFQKLADKFLVRGNVSQSDLMKADQLTYLPNDILAKMDRMSMAHGLEVRPVYLDPSIVGFSRIGAVKNPELFIKKRILKDLFGERIGDSYLPPKKLGFSIPVHAWFRGRLRPFFEDLINTEYFKTSEVLNSKAVDALYQKHLRGGGNYGFELWGIMILGIWHHNNFAKGV